MAKEFIPYDDLRNNALKLAYEIHQQGFVPDVIYVPLRGGAYLGNIISEYFKMVKKDQQRPVLYAAVVARSYTDIRQQDRIMIDGWTYNPEYLRTGDKILFVDDIFDTGRTINHLVDVILQTGIPRRDVKIAVHDYKKVNYRQQLPIQPDFYSRCLDINTPEEDVWIHYLSHELVGLTAEEREKYLYKQDPELRKVFPSDR